VLKVELVAKGRLCSTRGLDWAKMWEQVEGGVLVKPRWGGQEVAELVCADAGKEYIDDY
jgi:hypothetical protein